jgi:Flp pilus assembly protein TadD
VLNNLAFLLAEKGNLKEALPLAARARQREPANPEFSDTLGWIYLKMKATDKAVEVFEALVRRYPDNPRVRYHLSLGLLQRGDESGARIQLKAALKEGPTEQDRVAIEQTLAKMGSAPK